MPHDHSRDLARFNALPLAGICALALVMAPAGARAATLDAAPDASPDPAGSSGFPESAGTGDVGGGWWSLHAQGTFTAQGVTALAISAVVLGLAYGAAAPASTHLLAPKTPAAIFNTIMSFRQIGVPLGGVLAALMLPPLVAHVGWRGALLTETVPVVLLIGLMEIPRKRWDAELDRTRYRLAQTIVRPFALLADKRIRRLSLGTFIFSGLQLCFVSFMTVQLTTVVHMDLVSAGRILALYQIAGSVSRPIWGWVADRFLTPSATLAVHGAGMAAAAALTGQFGALWPVWGVVAVALLAGCTAGGYTGVAYAEYAHLGSTRRTEATGLGTALMFSGGMLMPTAFAAAIASSGHYGLAYGAAAALALLGALSLAMGGGRWGMGSAAGR